MLTATPHPHTLPTAPFPAPEQQSAVEHLELVRLPAGGWVITDLARPHDDPRCLVAYVQEDGSRYEAVWVQAPVSVGWFESLDAIITEALARKTPRAA
jgi:hypothetical protein